MTTGQWFWTLVILAVPLLNVIMYIVWALGSGNRSRVTYCRASMLIALIGIAIYAVLIGVGLFAGDAIAVAP
jgi:hypothetical protein